MAREGKQKGFWPLAFVFGLMLFSALIIGGLGRSLRRQ